MAQVRIDTDPAGVQTICIDRSREHLDGVRPRWIGR
jgi:hypothetical protein